MGAFNHYIRVDNNRMVVRAFSDAFENPKENDILIESETTRHYNLQLTNWRGQYLLKWDGKQLAERTQEELDNEWSERVTEPTGAVLLGQELAQLKLQTMQQNQLLTSMGVELAATKLELINLKGDGTK